MDLKSDWKHYNVHWEKDGRKGKTTITALSKEDAQLNFEGYAAALMSDKHIAYPFEATVLKVIGPLGVHATTPKQKLAQQYRSCIGAAKMTEKSIQAINTWPLAATKEESIRYANIQKGALKNIANVMRDIKDIFKRQGLKVK